jgi:hypothetical protein
MKHNLRLLIAKLETVYGTDSTPTAVANAALVRDLNATVLEVAYDGRANIKPFFGNDQQIPASFYGMIEFSFELQGSGTLGTAPAWGVFMRAAGHAEVITAATKVEYTPVSAAEESATMWFYHDGDLFKMVGCKGSISYEFAAGKAPLAKAKFMGLCSQAGAISSAALPVATLTAWKLPVSVNKTNTTFSLGGYAAALESLSIDMAHTTPYINRPNTERIDFSDRKASGTVVIEKPTFAQKDFYTAIKNAALQGMALAHGTTAGLRVKIDTTECQLQKPSDSEQDNVTLMSMPLLLVPTANGSEIKITLD